MRNRTCTCGSGLPAKQHFDGYGIYIFIACSRCYSDKRARFRKDIFERYETDEPIDDE